MIARLVHRSDSRPFDPLAVPIESGAPMNPASVPPKRISKWQPLIDRMAPGQSCVLERDDGLAFVRWGRAQPGVTLAQSKVSPVRMRVKVLVKP